MALEAVLAAGWGISAGYNKQRFTFDSAMSQRSAHYMQHMRIKQWHIFREDVRDLFTLTTAHLITYMTMGSLMLSWDARLTVFKGMNDMKDQPAWFFLFWSNCCLGAILFGFLGLWLVVHGALKSQAAAVQVLTQSVRPPIPSSQEVIAVGHDLAEYESLGAKKFFEVPNLFGWRDNGMHKTAVEKSERHGLENSHGILEATRAMTIVEEVEMGTSFKSSHETQKRAATVLNDARTGRPGQSAIFDKHIPIFHTMQRTFASYDAYARISVDVSVTFWLMAVGYYFISFTMAYEDSAALLSEHIVAAIFSWCGVAAMLSVGSVLMGLELFVSTRHAFWVNVFLQSGPLLGCLAVHLHVLERHGAVERFPVHINPATIALLSIVGHVSWMVSMMYQARPIKDHPLGLPSNFRAVRYLDVFGWTADSETRKEVVKNEKGQLVSEAVTEAKRIRRDIERILHAHDAQLNNEEIEKLMKAATMITKAIRNDSDIKQVIWLLMEKQTENSMKKQFFVHVPSELAQQEHPRDGRVVNLPLLAADTSSLLVQVGLNEPRTRNYSIGISEVGDDEDTSPRAASVRLPSGLPKLPGSRYSDYDLPWRYFRQIAVLVFTCWGVTFVVLSLFRLGAITEAPIKPVNTTLPHKPFKLSAFSCNKFLLALADGFEVHAAGRPTSHEDFEHIEGNSYFSLMLAEEVSFQWRSVTITDCEEADCSSLLLLDPSGHAVEERSTHLGSVRTRWTMHPDFTTPLLMISSLPPTVAKELCFRKSPKLQSATSGPGEHWGLMSATAVGEFVAFCPRGGHLEPVRAGVDVPRLHVEVIGLQVDSHGVLWTVLSSNAGHAELKAWSLNGTLRGTWALPKRRQWVPGMCEFSRGMVLADSGGSKAGVAAPQLWHVQPQLLGSADERHSSFTETLSLVM